MIKPLEIKGLESVKSIFPTEKELLKMQLEGIGSPFFKGLEGVKSIEPIIKPELQEKPKSDIGSQPPTA